MDVDLSSDIKDEIKELLVASGNVSDEQRDIIKEHARDKFIAKNIDSVLEAYKGKLEEEYKVKLSKIINLPFYRFLSISFFVCIFKKKLITQHNNPE